MRQAPEAPTSNLDAARPISVEKFLRSLFYLFLGKKARQPVHDLSHLWDWACGQVGDIAIGLLHCTQAIAYEEGFIHQKAEIVWVQGHPASQLAIQQRNQFQ